MRKTRKIRMLLGPVLTLALVLSSFAVPSNAAHEVTTELTLHISGDRVETTREYQVQLDEVVCPVSADPSIVTATQNGSWQATGTAAAAGIKRITSIVYKAVKPGTTTVNLYYGSTNKPVTGPIKVTVTDHKWDTKYTVDEEATCTAEGIESIHCLEDGCDAVKPDSMRMIPMIPHNWEKKYTVDVDPTYFETGVKSHHCLVCDAVDEDSYATIPKLKLGKAKIQYAKNPKKQIVKVKMKMMEGPSGFDFSYGTSSSFDASKTKTVYTKSINVKLVNLRVGTTYYFRARAVLKEDGKKAKGKWSKAKSLKVTQ